MTNTPSAGKWYHDDITVLSVIAVVFATATATHYAFDSLLFTVLVTGVVAAYSLDVAQDVYERRRRNL